MRKLLREFQLNLGFKRALFHHPIPSALLAMLRPGRLRLPVATLAEILGAPPPPIAFRYFAPPPMNTGPNDLVPLCTLAAASGTQRILEVGCHLGAGTLSLATACPSARIVTYDILPQAGAFIVKSEPALRDRIERRIVSFPSDAARLHAEPPYDFIYIDGDHTAASVHADTELALEILAPGGLIVWHDYCHHGGDWLLGVNFVPEVLNVLATRLKLQHVEGTWLAVWRKPTA